MIIFQSVIGNTRAFVQKSGLESLEITPENYDEIKVDQNFILVAPTYDHETTYILDEFMKYQDNYKHCQGVFGGGNRNFMDLFCYTAKKISKYFDVPLLHLFEFQGSQYDVDQLIKEHQDKCQN